MKYPFSITKEHLEKSLQLTGKGEENIGYDDEFYNYRDNKNCPFAVAFKDQFPHLWADDVYVYTYLVGHGNSWRFNIKTVAKISDAFLPHNYSNLLNGEEFHTEIEILEGQ